MSDKTMDSFLKAFGKDTVSFDEVEPPELISSGVYCLDKLFKVKGHRYKKNKDKNRYGLPLNRIIQIIGDSNIGKSILLLHICKSFLEKKKKILYIDAERSVSTSIGKNIGISVENFPNLKNDFIVLTQENSIAKFYETILHPSVPKSFDLVIVDSLSALTDRLDENSTDLQLGSAAKQHTIGFNKLINSTEKNNMTFIFVNQKREKIDTNPYQAKSFKTYNLPCGNGVQFSTYVTIHLTKGKQIKMKNDAVVGDYVNIRTDKSKIGATREKNCSVIRYTGAQGEDDGRGYDENLQILMICEELGLLKKEGNTYIIESSLSGSKEDIKISSKENLFNYFLNKEYDEKRQKILNNIKKSTLEKYFD